MLVQVRDGALRLVEQHDHALLAGELARRWRGPGGREEPLPFLVVLAVALHDVGWTRLDRPPRFDRGSGRPYTFDAHPLSGKLSAYRSGVDRMAEVHPYAGLLGSLHYASFLDHDRAGAFLSSERERRRRLLERLGGERGRGEVEARARRDLSRLKLFDNLSLSLCLSGPDVRAESRPSWLERDDFLTTPEGRSLRLDWEDETTASVRPFCFDAPVRLELPYRELAAERYEGEDAFRRAWRSSSRATVRVDVVPAKEGRGGTGRSS